MIKIILMLCVFFLLPALHPGCGPIESPFASYAFAGDVEPKDINPAGKPPAWEWTLTANQTVSGVSDTANNVQYCKGPKSLIITMAPGTVNATFIINDDGVEITQLKDASGTLENITLTTSAGVKKITASIKSKRIYVNSTITSGTVSSIKLICD